MKKQTFHFEIKDVLTQFIAAFDDIIIKRYDKDRVPANDIQVRYVYAPKQRVLYDIVNLAQNITVPVVSVSISNVSRDDTRVFNKIEGYHFFRGANDKTGHPTAMSYRSPVPVNISISMSILTKYQSDMDQILSNFIPYNNPYIIISWKVPDSVVSEGFNIPQEIRSEVLWGGSVSISYPTDLNASKKYQIIGDTTFVIKGWLFCAQRDNAKAIYYIDSNFHTNRNITLYSELTGDTIIYPVSSGVVNETETVSISGFPHVTNTIDYSYDV